MGIQRAVERRERMEEAVVERDELLARVELLQENFDAAVRQLAFEDKGWSLAYGGQVDNATGPTLDQVKEVSEKNRTYVAGHPLIKHAQVLRTSYIHSKGMDIPGITDEKSKRTPKKQGRKPALETFYNDPANQECLFGEDAALHMEQSLITDGVFLVVGDTNTKKMRSITINDIVDVYVSDEYPDEIWAYMRQWNSYSRVTNKTEVKHEWIFTDRYTDTLPSNITRGGKDVPVAKNKRIFDLWVNRQTGWSFGAGDAMTAIAWVRMYTELVMDGKTMTEALSKFAAQIKVKSKKGADAVGVRVARNRGAGQMATVGEGNEISVFQSAGKTYDFNGLRPIAALIAAGMDVSIVHLLSDPGAAGSSYGSASNLDLPQKRAMVLRQNQWKAFFRRVLKWATDQDIQVSFPDLEDQEAYRKGQLIALAWDRGMIHPEEGRLAFLKVADIPVLEDTVPDGILIPNNEKSLARRDIDTDGATPSTAPQAASPDQGRSNGTGGTSSAAANDQRSDVLESMRNDEFLDRFESLVARMERAKG